MRNVLITGARAPIALDLARSFAAAGWVPHLADSISPWAAKLGGVASDCLHRFAPPRFAFDAFASDLGELISRLNPELIVPTCEEVFYIAAAAERMGFSDRVFAPDITTLSHLHSKVGFVELASACGLTVPQTQRVVSKRELDAWRGQESGLVFKPEFSRFASHALVRPKPKAVAVLSPSKQQPWAVQDFVEGEELCIWSAAINGEIVAYAAYKPLWRFGRSASFYFESDPNPALIQIPRVIARATKATGHLAFDVIRRSDGVIVPIECNPRGISGIHLFDSEPRLAKALMGYPGLEVNKAGARHLGPAMWLLGAPCALATGRWQNFRQDLQRSHSVLGSAGTPFGSVGTLLDATRFLMVGLSRGRSASGQSTDDIEWNGEKIV